MYLLFIGYVMILYYLFIIFPVVYTCLSVLNKGFYVPIVHRICNDIVLPIHKYITVVMICLILGFYYLFKKYVSLK